MIPCIGVRIQGRTFYPLYNVNAAVILKEQYADHESLVKDLCDNSRAGYELALEVFGILTQEGNAVRKNNGYEPGDKPDHNEAFTEYSLADFERLRRAVVDAIILGSTNEMPDDEDRDLYLEELEKKTSAT